MRRRLAFPLLLVIAALAGIADAAVGEELRAPPLEAIADQAAALGREIPGGDERARDIALRTISQNLRKHGFAAQGLEAAEAMTGTERAAQLAAARDGPPTSAPPPAPSYVRFADRDGCSEADWRRVRPAQAADTAIRCFLDGDFHWTGPPSRAAVIAALAAMPASETKAQLVIWLASQYPGRKSTALAFQEAQALAPLLPAAPAGRLRAFFERPLPLYRLGRVEEALRRAGAAPDFHELADLIVLLVWDGRADRAVSLLPVLAQTESGFLEGCDAWFNPIGIFPTGLSNHDLPPLQRRALGEFLDRLGSSQAVRATCPDGIPPEGHAAMLFAAGRDEAALARVAELGDALQLAEMLDAAGARAWRESDQARAEAYFLRAYRAVPPFQVGEMAANNLSTRVRQSLIGHLAAVGQMDRAYALAVDLPAPAWRAVGLSILVAGREGIPMTLDGVGPSVIDPGSVPLPKAE